MSDDSAVVRCDECDRPIDFDARAVEILRAAGGRITCKRHGEPDNWCARRGDTYAVMPSGWQGDVESDESKHNKSDEPRDDGTRSR